MLRALGHSMVTELPLSTGHRADIVSLSRNGEVWIVEIKSCLADYRSDSKWNEYRAHCDRFLFGVDADFPRTDLPDDTGLIIADRFGATLLREAPEHKISGARRKAVMLRFARAAALRLHALADPGALTEL